MWLLILEGLAIGCLLGLTGAGGGILAIPALMTTQSWTVAQAAPVGLLAITLSAFIGTVQGLLNKIVRYRAAIWIALISIPFARYGVHLSHSINPAWLTLGFSLVMLIIAYRIFFNRINDWENPPCKVNPSTGRLIWNIKTASILGLLGVVTGLLTGLLGVGGGFVIVPALRKVSNLDMYSIVATSLMIIFLIGGLSIFIHLIDGFHYPLEITLSFVIACIVGMLIGRKIINLIEIKTVQRFFAITVTVVAVYLIFSALTLMDLLS